MQLTETAETVLKRRYYLKDEKGAPIEDWDALCHRVAHAIASQEIKEEAPYYCKQFYKMINELDFLPNSPCLMNAGTELGQLSACFVLPIEDTLDGIFTAIRNGALVNKTGGGTGYSFSRLRPKDATVCSTSGVASGPISFATVFDQATEVIKQGGRRRGANMGVLRCDHPDILEFIDCKRDKSQLNNFNLSVALTNEFMRKVGAGESYNLIDPSTGKITGTLSASDVFDKIIDAAWDNGEPGVLFIDAANRANPTPWLGDFEATNPCGEQWLLPYESCNLGSINLGRFVKVAIADHNNYEIKVDWGRLEEITRLATRFLDNVVDANKFPIPEIKEATQKTRKIGLGIMGLHDMLIKLGIPYASEEGRRTAAKVMQFIRDVANEESNFLANEKGVCPAFSDSQGDGASSRRNASLTSIQPTGTVSMIADCSSGCEPYFALVNRKNVMDNDSFIMVNPLFEQVMRERGLYSEELMAKVAEKGSVVGLEEIPADLQELFRCAQDISVDDHILMQAALQCSGVDSSISKTINMPSTATKEDVKQAYLKGWSLGCKGLTVYRDGCREGQVLTVGTKKEGEGASVFNEVKNTKEGGKMALPEVLDARRYKVKDQAGETIYLIICFDEDERPVEVFAKFAFDNRIEQSERATMWTTVCRLTSLSLRCGVPVEEVIKQLDRASGSMFDLPAQLSKLFKSFMAKTVHGYVAGDCPDCKGRLIFQEGCLLCFDCGFSKCS